MSFEVQSWQSPGGSVCVINNCWYTAATPLECLEETFPVWARRVAGLRQALAVAGAFGDPDAFFWAT